MTESKYQNKIIKKLEAEGYYVLKLLRTNKNGIPDILALKDGKRPLFIEVKGAKGKVAPLQQFRINELNKLNFKAIVSYAPESN